MNKDRICKESGCNSIVYARDMCQKHYDKFKRNNKNLREYGVKYTPNKKCENCGKLIIPKEKISKNKYDEVKYCSKECSLSVTHKKIRKNNEFSIKDDYAIVYIYCKQTKLEVLIDKEDIEKIINFKNCWRGYKPKDNNNIYSATYITENGKKKRVSMHRLITNAPDGLVVDHINHNTLDNRKSNLRVVTTAENGQNRLLNSNNSTGVRNVYWSAKDKRYKVYVQINGKQKYIGCFKNIEDAKNAMIQARIKHMAYSPENYYKGAI